jgi:hexokinase
MIIVTRQQEQFIQAIMRGMTQRQAYIYAFPNAQNWKPQNVDSKASNLLKDPSVALRYAELQREAAEANAITRDSVLAHLKLCAFADWGKFKPSDQIRAMELICRITGIDTPQDED